MTNVYAEALQDVAEAGSILTQMDEIAKRQGADSVRLSLRMTLLGVASLCGVDDFRHPHTFGVGAVGRSRLAST